jgi:hypothetical protein
MEENNMKFYEINFTLAAPAAFLVEAKSKKAAREIAEEELEKMSRREWLEYIKAAVDYAGFKITSIEQAE